MGALRRAGVWLGLVEEEDDRAYPGDYDDDFGEDDDFAPVRPRSPRAGDRATDRATLAERAAERAAERERERDRMERERHLADVRAHTGERPIVTDRGHAGDPVVAERGSVRPLARPGTGATSYPTQDNLALAPQVQLRERAVVADGYDTSHDGRYQITTVHPTTYSEARTIGEHFREGVPVIMNLTEMDEPDAKRLVDFAAGLAFGLRGSMERVTNRVFLLSPANVQVTAEDKEKIAQGGFFERD
jgi:cell division inhibitor SepF